MGMVLLLVCSFAGGKAQDIRLDWPRERLIQFSELNGQPLPGFNSITQDLAGFMWFGGPDGLFRFNGYDLEKKTAGQVSCVLLGPQGNIWFTSSERLFRKNPKTGNTIQIPLESAANCGILLRLRKLADGYIYAVGVGGTWRIDPEVLSVVKINLLGASDIAAGKDGHVWIASTEGLLFLNLADHRYSLFPLVEADVASLDPILISIFPRDDGMLWLGSENGMKLFDTLTHVYLPTFDMTIKGAGDGNVVSDVYGDQEGHLWISSYNGIYSFDRDREKLTYFGAGNAQSDVNAVRFEYIFEDRHGGLWFSSDTGVSYYHRSNQVVTTGRIVGDSRLLNSMNRIFAYLQVPSGEHWIGSRAGLTVFDPNLKLKKHIVYEGKESKTLSADAVLNLVLAPNGDILVGTKGGFDRFSDGANIFQYFNPSGVRDFKFNNGLLYLTEIDDLFVMKGGEIIDTITTDWLLRPMEHIRDQVFLIGTRKNLFLLFADQKRFQAFAFKNLPVEKFGELGGGIARSANDDIWLASSKGFFRWSRKNQLQMQLEGEFFAVPGLGRVGNIEVDGFGVIWGRKSNKVGAFEPMTGKLHIFDRSHGVFAEGRLIRQQDGRILAASAGGINIFDSKKLSSEKIDAPLCFTELTTMGKQLNLEAGLPEELVLDHDNRVFSATFATLDYRDMPKNRRLTYAYQLEGYLDEWQDLGTTNTVSFSNLSRGSYTLRVKGTNSEGHWVSSQPSLAIRIKSPLWRSPLAMTAYAVILVLLLVLLLRLRQERRLARHLQRVDRLKDDFLANTSHELRTPLNGIMGLLDGLLDGVAGPLNEGMVANLGMVRSSAGRLASLVNDLLDFSKLKEHDLSLQCRALDLFAVAEVVMVLSRPLVRGKDLCLINEIPHDLPPVLADENRLQQILHNLLGNGIKFTESGRVCISAALEGEMVQVRVVDTGIGIRAEDLPLIWASFSQVDATLTRSHGGTGLGLAITRQLVELHGGQIWADSTPGQGSTFCFSLPVAGKEAVGPTRVLAPSKPLPDWRLGISSGAGSRILVVDDEAINRQVLVNHLSLRGYGVQEAADGVEALAVLARDNHGIDLVVLDVMMPRKSGFDVCRALRRDTAMQDLPIIFLTARTQTQDLVAGFEAGGNDYLTKPVVKEELLSRIETHLLLLDATRDLEDKVAARTRDLSSKNAEILQRQDQLIMQEKMAFLGALAGGVAHEIQNPLNFMNNLVTLSNESLQELAELLEEQRAQLPQSRFEAMREALDELTKNLTISGEHGGRVSGFVNALRDYGREQKQTQPQRVDFNQFVARYGRLARGCHYSGQKAAGMVLEDRLDPAVGQVLIRPGELSHVLSHLVNNGIEACLARGRGEEDFRGVLVLETQRRGDTVRLSVRDNGEGIGGHRAEIFKPFFTTRTHPANIGLGLSVCLEVADRALSADLLLEPEGAGGATFSLVFRALPAQEPEKA